MTTPDAPADFDAYTRSLDCLVMVDEPADDRIAAAYCAGLGRQTHPPVLLSPSPYLFDHLFEAFTRGQEDR